MATIIPRQTLVLEKHPLAVISQVLDWSKYAAAIGSPTISSSTWVDVTSPTNGITLASAAVNTYATSVFIGGGTSGVDAFVENRVTFDNGVTDVQLVRLVVTDGISA